MNASIKERYDVCIVGTGRVVFPRLSLIECGVSVLGLDIDERPRTFANDGLMPFAEPGYDELVARKDLYVTGDASHISRCDAIVITVKSTTLISKRT